MSRQFPVKGLAEIDRFLSALPKNMQKGAYRAGLTAAAGVIRDEARQRAPRQSGQMAKSIKSGSPRQNQDGSFQISIRLEGPHSFLGPFFEFGVSPHVITGGDATVTARALNKRQRRGGSEIKQNNGLLKIGGSWVRGAVLHPGHRAHPFLRPALDAKADEAVQAFAGRIRDYLEGKTGFAVPLDEAA